MSITITPTPPDTTHPDWYPVAPAAEVRAGDNIVAGFARGVELALWRSADGTAQAWENRCPHRSVRFTLGQVMGDRLSCAYHGWQYAAGTGQCAGIPAHPTMPPPRNVCAKVYLAAEADGMIWVCLDAQAPRSPPPAGMVPPDWHFCRTLTLCSTVGAVRTALQTQQFQPKAEPTWRGALDSVPVAAVVLDARPGQVFVHVWTEAAPGSTRMKTLHAAVRRLRSTVENVAS